MLNQTGQAGHRELKKNTSKTSIGGEAHEATPILTPIPQTADQKAEQEDLQFSHAPDSK